MAATVVVTDPRCKADVSNRSPAARGDSEQSFWFDHARSALYGPTDPAREKRLQDQGNQVRNHPEYRTGITTTAGTGGAATMPICDEAHFVIDAHQLAPLAGLATNLALPAHANAMVLPQITTGVNAAIQSPQNSSVTDGATYVDAAATCDAVTALAQINLSRQ
jgi:hypothetical protein